MGVAMVVAVDLASESARSAYTLATETLAGRATHRILGLAGDLPDSLYAALRMAGLRDAPEPAAHDTGPGGPRRGPVPARRGCRVPGCRVPVLPRAAPPGGRGPLLLPGAGRLRPGGGLRGGRAGRKPVGADGAARLGAAVPPRRRPPGRAAGDTLTLRAGSRTFTVTVIGFLDPRNRLAAALVDDLVLADLSTAQEALDAPGRLGRIELDLSGAGTEPARPGRSAAPAATRPWSAASGRCCPRKPSCKTPTRGPAPWIP